MDFEDYLEFVVNLLELKFHLLFLSTALEALLFDQID